MHFAYAQLLFVILQKYDFSSKSQQIGAYLTILKAVCDTAKVRFFKQITTYNGFKIEQLKLFVILQKYDFSSKSQPLTYSNEFIPAVCDTAKVRFFKQITTERQGQAARQPLFVILQKYDFSSKSQLLWAWLIKMSAVCDTAKVRFFKQITTLCSLQYRKG